MKKLRTLILCAMLLAFIALTAPVFAVKAASFTVAPPVQTQPMGLSDFLVYLVSGGAIIIVSWLLEYTGWFQNLAAKAKQMVFFGLCLVVALGAYAIQTYVPAAVLAQIEPFFQIIAMTFIAIFTGSGFHKLTKAS